MNEKITAREVRVIDNDGKMLGVYPVLEAIQMASSKTLDLIEIAPNATPPTCRIMDYGKWKYEQKRKEKDAKKKRTVITVKEIQIRPRTDDHDIDVKLKNARKFLLEGNKVKINLRFQGREMAHQQIGKDVLSKVAEKLTDLAVVEMAPKMEGRQLFLIMAPDATKLKEYEAKVKQIKKDGIAPPEEVPAESTPVSESAE